MTNAATNPPSIPYSSLDSQAERSIEAEGKRATEQQPRGIGESKPVGYGAIKVLKDLRLIGKGKRPDTPESLRPGDLEQPVMEFLARAERLISHVSSSDQPHQVIRPFAAELFDIQVVLKKYVDDIGTLLAYGMCKPDGTRAEIPLREPREAHETDIAWNRNTRSRLHRELFEAHRELGESRGQAFRVASYWTQKPLETEWPSEFVPRKEARDRVYQQVYETHIAGGSSRVDAHEHAAYAAYSDTDFEPPDFEEDLRRS